jgi:hypothetical protein
MTECLSCFQLRFHVILVNRAVSPDLASSTIDLAVGDLLLCIVVPVFTSSGWKFPHLTHHFLFPGTQSSSRFRNIVQMPVNGWPMSMSRDFAATTARASVLQGQVQRNTVDRTNKTEYVGKYFIGESEECWGLLWKEDLE